ncbi:MAG: family metalloprotease domain protein [Bacteroidetes bacterium]|nr:family metalloprotease domain protein [Bacteroidota bacterium]
MKTINNLFSLIIIIAFACNSVFAIPADNTHIFSKKQSNGKIISYTLNGDEFISWATSLDGYTLLEKNNGDIVYAVVNEEGKLIKSDVLACDNQYRTIEDNIFLSTIKKGLFYNSTQIEQCKQNRVQRYSDNSRNYTPTTGTPNFLVILVSFADIPFNSANVTTMQNQISQANYTVNGATGSVKDYFFDNSMETLNANFTIVGPYTLSHNQAYYGAEAEYFHDTLPREMAAEACSLANPYVNFANFDNDNDGYVDMVHVVYAGIGQHNGGGTNAIWAHRWVLPTPTNFDGVYAYDYSCSNELRTTTSIDGIGTTCHEMGHVLGLPDFYDTDNEGSGGQAIDLVTWDLMAIGSYNNNSRTPPYLSALERQILGWLTPISLTANTSNCTLPAISDSNKAYKVVLSTNEFLMFEHRNKKKWDAYTPAKGMLVFHGDNNLINPWLTSGINDINVNPYDRGYFIIPASGDSTNINSTSTTFPGSTNQTSFTNSALKNGTLTGKALVSITYGADSVITFSFINNAPIVTANVATNISQNSVILNGTITGGSEVISSQGFEYKLSSASTWTTITTTINGNAITHNLLGLTPNTAYQYRAYATTSLGTVYGTTQSFTTLAIVPPTVVTSLATAISQNTATLNGTITIGSSTVIVQGFQWKLSNASTWTTITETLNGNAITHNLLGLTPNTAYQYRAYATTSLGTVYGTTQNFITLAIVHPTVITIPATSISYTTVTLNGTITAGSEAIISQGFEYKLSSASTWTTITATLNGNVMTHNLTGLYSNYTYQFKAFTTTASGTFYGEIQSFTTLEITPPIVITNSATPISGTTATLSGTITAETETILAQGFKWKQTNASQWEEVSAILNGDDITYELTNLIPNQSYKFRAFATTESGETNGLIKTFTTLGLIEVERDEISIIIYPNPTNSTSNLIIENVNGNIIIRITDVRGRVLQELKENANNKYETQIDLSNYSKGEYFINVITDKSKRIEKLILK